MIGKVRSAVKKRFQKPKSFIPVDRNFLSSTEYEQLMSKFLPYPKVYDLHEAQNKTQNFLFRHMEMNHRLGAFRWRGVYKHRDFIMQAIGTEKTKVLDLGGAASPLGFHAKVVDFLEKDAYGRAVPYRTLDQVEEAVDVVFTSHTLEHIPELETVVQQVQQVLVPGGLFIIHVPAYHCERWRAGIHTNRVYNDHYWTFGLAGSEVPDGLVNYNEIDQFIGRFFEVELAEYCGDDSIFIVAKKEERIES